MNTEDEALLNPSADRIQVLRGRLTRSIGDRIVAGLAGGIAARLGIPTVFVRAGFVALTLAGGFGVLCYVVGWLITPDERQYGSMIVADRPATTSQEVG
ncbi:MAG: PspC domain-containing protein, partial [Acidimicrobiia bacterium]|nr:PspC domain-containing protein [Acidimicrobiia bacterium]